MSEKSPKLQISGLIFQYDFLERMIVNFHSKPNNGNE
jgi:hypothetical protein